MPKRTPGLVRHASADPHVREAADAVDARKAKMGRPKLYGDLVAELKTRPEGRTSGRKKKKRPFNSPSNDITARGRRQPGSGWAGKGQR